MLQEQGYRKRQPEPMRYLLHFSTINMIHEGMTAREKGQVFKKVQKPKATCLCAHRWHAGIAELCPKHREKTEFRTLSLNGGNICECKTMRSFQFWTPSGRNAQVNSLFFFFLSHYNTDRPDFRPESQRHFKVEMLIPAM